MNHNSSNNFDYDHFRHVLCVDRSEDSLQKRGKMFKDFDPNGNGYLSLAECDKGVRDVLKLPDLFLMKQVIMRAFQAARGSVKNKSKVSDDYIERNEFRFFLCYLRQYFELYEMFELINSDSDKYIEYDEFVAGIPKFEKWGVKVQDPKTTFNEIDTDKGGKIRFEEFCHWAIKNKLDIDTDDDFQDNCLDNLN